MMKCLFIVYLLCFSNSIFGQNRKPRTQTDLFKAEVGKFVDTLKSMTIGSGKYDVYVASLYQMDTNSTALCFTFGHIYNANPAEFRSIAPSHYFLYENEFVLIKGPENLLILLEDLHLKELDSVAKQKIFAKLHPTDVNGFPAGITGISKGLVGCISQNHVQKVFYRNSDQIPQQVSVYNSFPEGMEIELIRSPSNPLETPARVPIPKF